MELDSLVGVIPARDTPAAAGMAAAIPVVATLEGATRVVAAGAAVADRRAVTPMASRSCSGWHSKPADAFTRYRSTTRSSRFTLALGRSCATNTAWASPQ